ncbi:MAG TPA: T9SS type B sorting domain-containing protein, partial [Bacteroidia bacterium]|nr:T9SS type B sorting domain-containing protein [Bacteroidia bacterium]
DVYLGGLISLCGQFNITLDAGIVNANSYQWSSGQTTQTINVAEAGTYWVQVNNGNCVMTDTIEVTGAPGEGVLFVPNSFTPNGNSTNDRFTAYGDGITSYRMRIFDRWGMLLLDTSDMNAGWDGKFKGQYVQEDTYVYVIDYRTECSDGKTKREIGHVNVIR